MTNLKPIAQALQSKGRYGDTILAHINPQEAELLKLLGGSGTTNPDTGLPEYWGGFGSIFSAVTQFIAPVAIVVTAIVAPEILPALGSSIASTLGIGTVSATTAAAIGAGAVGAASSALNTAVAGGNGEQILKAAAIGGAASAAGSEIGSTVGEATSDLGPTASNLAKATVGGAASPFIKDELSGTNLQTATKGAELGGATGALTSGISQATGATPGETTALGSAIGTALNYSNVFGTQPTSSSQVGSAPQGSTTLTGQVGAPTAAGSTVLGSALGFGSDPSGPIQTTEGGGSTRNVWNQASLRNPDQTGGSNV